MNRIEIILSKIKLPLLFITVLMQFACASLKPEKEPSIYDHRMGELTVKEKPGATVIIEQVAHEFWFECAIPNSFADGSMSENDKKQFEE